MMINQERIQRLLIRQGFQLGFFDDDTLEILYVRKHEKTLFERIRVGIGHQRGGRVGGLVNAGVECAIVPGRTALKGMAEYVCLTEIASDPRSGWMTLSNAQDAVLWEEKLAVIAPSRASELAQKVGPEILARTSDARIAAARYLERCSGIGSAEELLARLKAQATESQLGECSRMLSRPIVCIPNGRVFYEIAALAITIFAGEVEGDPHWLEGREPDSAPDRGLMIRLQVMASKLAREPGW